MTCLMIGIRKHDEIHSCVTLVGTIIHKLQRVEVHGRMRKKKHEERPWPDRNLSKQLMTHESVTTKNRHFARNMLKHVDICT